MHSEHKSDSATRSRTQALALRQISVTPVALTIIGIVAFSFVGSLVAEAAPARQVSSPFLYTFNSAGVLHETGSMQDSSSPYFWLNSGGKMMIGGGTGGTIHGALSPLDSWYKLYGGSSSVDTDGGKYPQNLFRFVTRSTWNNPVQEVRFRIDEINMTNTPNRDGYSGILLMSNYQDGANLYYAGIRMDGKAIIKKKYKGTYYTLATKSVFPGSYNKSSNPNLIPENTWMRLKTDSKVQPNGSVQLTLSLDRGNGTYETLLSVNDTKAQGGGVLTGGYAGIRTDYMDATFDNYKLTRR
jgi:hypothetical protein